MTIREKEKLFIESLKIDKKFNSSVLHQEVFIVGKTSNPNDPKLSYIDQINYQASHPTYKGFLISIKIHRDKNENKFIFKDLYLFSDSNLKFEPGSFISSPADNNYFIYSSVIKMICTKILSRLNNAIEVDLTTYLNSIVKNTTQGTKLTFDDKDKSNMYCLDVYLNDHLKAKQILEKL